MNAEWTDVAGDIEWRGITLTFDEGDSNYLDTPVWSVSRSFPGRGLPSSFSRIEVSYNQDTLFFEATALGLNTRGRGVGPTPQEALEAALAQIISSVRIFQDWVTETAAS
jgi:hypothetical protein